MHIQDKNSIPIRRGWRAFTCPNPECNHRFEEATRDRFSPSSTECPQCNESCHPESNRVDADLAIDDMGNLTAPWSERIRSLL